MSANKASERAVMLVNEFNNAIHAVAHDPTSANIEAARRWFEVLTTYLSKLEAVVDAASKFVNSSEADGWTCLYPVRDALAALGKEGA